MERDSTLDVKHASSDCASNATIAVMSNSPLANAGALDDVIKAQGVQEQTHKEDQQMGRRCMAPSHRFHLYSKPSNYGVDLGRPRRKQREEIRARYPDDAQCAHRHPQPFHERTHTNLECLQQRWRLDGAGPLQRPIRAASPPVFPRQLQRAQPIAPPCVQVAAPAMPTIDACGSQFMFVGDANQLKSAAEALFNRG